ncbi:MAG: hypothetical protein Q8Q00_04290 [Dehalococcoidia bacterium]|nr:hypothetical protein [Dehalococcoidia bacterium]
MKHRLLLLIAVAVTLAALAACSDGAAIKPTEVPRRTPTPAVSPKPSGKEREIPERTGVRGLDAIIEGFMQHDTKNLLLPNLRYSMLPCGLTPGMGGSPPCRADQEIGAAVEVMPFSACEFGYYGPHEFELILADLAQQGLYGVYRATPEVRFPGDYVIILTEPQPDDPTLQGATEVTVADGRLVGVAFSCVLTPEELVQEHGLEEPLFAP